MSFLKEVIDNDPRVLGFAIILVSLFGLMIARKVNAKRKQNKLEAEYSDMDGEGLYLETGEPNTAKINKGVELAKSYMDCYVEYRGIRHEKKDPGDVNRERAWKYIQAGVEIDNVDAIRMMGDIYRKGVHTNTTHLEPNYEMAKSYYTRAMDKNDPVAMYELGMMYYKGIGVDKDRKYGESLLRNSSNMGFDVAKQWFSSRLTTRLTIIFAIIFFLIMILPMILIWVL